MLYLCGSNRNTNPDSYGNPDVNGDLYPDINFNANVDPNLDGYFNADINANLDGNEYPNVDFNANVDGYFNSNVNPNAYTSVYFAIRSTLVVHSLFQSPRILKILLSLI